MSKQYIHIPTNKVYIKKDKFIIIISDSGDEVEPITVEI